MRTALCAVAGLLSFLILPSDLHACSCVTGIPICETFWKTDVVVAGEVVEQVRLETAGKPALFARRRMRFRVEGVYRGDVPDVVDVHTGAGGGDCGYAFRTGSRYLVYANRLNGKLRTGICNRTRPLARAAEDLEYFRTAMEPSATGRVYGAASYIGVGNQQRRPVRGYTVVLSDGRSEWRSKTDANGGFEFPSVPAGKCTVRLLVPGTEVAHGTTAIELSDPRGCATATFQCRGETSATYKSAQRSSRHVAPSLLYTWQLRSDATLDGRRTSHPIDGERNASPRFVTYGRSWAVEVHVMPTTRHRQGTSWIVCGSPDLRRST